ncbi:MAG: putative rane transporter protein [Pedosphaera sp.]|nr:putative rane transporter protein [Pedosphaera sp.]
MHWPFIALTLVIAGFVQGLTGFGFGLVSMSLLPLALDLKQAATIATIYGLLVTVGTFFQHYREFNWRLGATFYFSSCIGVPIGVYCLERTSESILLRVLGTMMLIFAAREFFMRQKLQPISQAVSVPFGLFSGSLSGAFNLGGIPTAAYAYAHPWTQGQIMAFLQVVITSSCILRLFCYGRVGYFKEFSWGFAAVVALPLFIAMISGHYCMRRIDPKRMRQAVFLFIAVFGVYYLLIHR